MRYRRTNLPVISRTWQPSCKTSLDACELHVLHPVCEHREAVVSLSYGTRPELSLLMLQEGLGNGIVAATVSSGHGQPLSLLSLAWLGGLARRIILLVAMICYVTLRGQKVSGDMSRSIWKARFWSIFSRIARYVEFSLGELYDVGTASIDLMLSARWTGHSVTDRWFSARVSFWKFVSCEAHWQAVRYPPEPEQEAMLKTAENCGPLTGQSNVGLSKNGDTPLFYLIRGSDDQPWDLRMPYFCGNPYAEVLHCLVMYSYWKWKCTWWWKLR